MAQRYDNGENTEDHRSYRSRLFEHRVRNFYTALLILAVLAVVGFVIWFQYSTHLYTGFDVLDTMKTEGAEGSQSIRMNQSLLTYSADGAHLTAGDGTVKWNQTYGIQDILLTENRGTVAIAGYNERNIYVLNEEKQLGSFTATMPIRNIAVSKEGRVTAVLADTDSAWINTYSSKGELIYTGQTHMTGSGYPAALALSPSGNMLMISYLYVDSGSVKSTVAFYNLSNVGDNYTDNLVKGQDYPDQIVPVVGFLSDRVSYAVGDGRLMLYEGAEQPVVKSETLFSEEILSVFDGNGYVGLIFASDKEGERYRLQIYNASGEQEGTYYFSLEYEDILFEKNDFVIYSESDCLIRTYSGRTKFDGGMDVAVQKILPTASAYQYVLVTGNEMIRIQLK
ncbi:MAG: DUF5711 family protein [Lachnospiraceae bacterium]|nr:DUF5711 family protein [Lachnospiraceae bacterium]